VIKPEVPNVAEAVRQFIADADVVREFRATWKDSAAYASKNLQRLRAFSASVSRRAGSTEMQSADALANLAGNGDYLFASGRAKPQTAGANWSRSLETVFKEAKAEGARSHRFRDTFAVSPLKAEVSLENVSVLPGHSSVKIAERHYSRG
jgi:integrase